MTWDSGETERAGLSLHGLSAERERAGLSVTWVKCRGLPTLQRDIRFRRQLYNS